MESTSYDEHSAAPSEALEATGDPTDTSSLLSQRRRRNQGGTDAKR